LRAWRADENDAAFLVDGWADREVARWSPVPNEPTSTTARRWLRQAAAVRTAPTAIDLVIVDATSDEPLGEVGVTEVDVERGTAVVGWWLVESARGKGHATRAVDGFASWLFEAFGVSRLAAIITADNVASVAVARRAGFAHRADLPDGRMVFERRAGSATVRSRP
jgi:RimJ/RimL family protein N-acetyltransferase